MANYYVRNDGNNSNTGTGPATNQAWETIAYAFANMTLTTGVNTLYIAPGVYRESPTLTVTPTATNTLVITGDPTASQFTGITANQVRVTGATLDTTTMAAGTRFNLGSKSYVTIQNFYIEQNAGATSSGAIISTGDFLSIRNNVIFSYFLGGSTGSAIQVTPPAATGNNIVIENNILVGTAYGIYVSLQSSSSGVSGVVIRNCRISTGYSGNGYGIALAIVSGANMASVTIRNCTISQSAAAAIYIDRGNTTDKHIVQNCIISLSSIAIQSATSNQVTQRNNILLCQTSLSNVATDATTITSDFLGIDYGQALLQGFGNLAPFGTSLNSRNTGFGTATSAPTTDMLGIAWTGATPDVGMATYRSLTTIGNYLPTERNASTITIAPGSTSQSIEIYLGATGLTASTSGLSAYYNRTRSADVQIPLVARVIDGSNPSGVWTAGGFAEVNASTMPGVYRLDLPDAAVAAGADDVTVVVRGASGTNGAVMTIKLSSGGLTAAQTAQAVLDAVASTHNNIGSIGAFIQDKTGYSLSTSQTFNTTGSVGSVAGNVTGNVVGTVGGVAGNITGNLSGSVGTVANPDNIIDAVWDEQRTGHTASGSFGEKLQTNALADEMLARDLGSGQNSGALQERTVRSALRALRNKVNVGSSQMVVKKEDDTTDAWTASVTTTAISSNVSGIDPD